jgi:hypothetical protein
MSSVMSDIDKAIQYNQGILFKHLLGQFFFYILNNSTQIFILFKVKFQILGY